MDHPYLRKLSADTEAETGGGWFDIEETFVFMRPGRMGSRKWMIRYCKPLFVFALGLVGEVAEVCRIKSTCTVGGALHPPEVQAHKKCRTVPINNALSLGCSCGPSRQDVNTTGYACKALGGRTFIGSINCSVVIEKKIVVCLDRGNVGGTKIYVSSR